MNKLQHIAFIMDGNGRWGKKKKKSRNYGHLKGLETVQKVVINSIKFKNKSDITITAIPGIEGLYPTLLMVKKSKKLLIANKEAIICGWNLIKTLASKNKTKIIPVDSEHFSILKLL